MYILHTNKEFLSFLCEICHALLNKKTLFVYEIFFQTVSIFPILHRIRIRINYNYTDPQHCVPEYIFSGRGLIYRTPPTIICGSTRKPLS